MGRRVFLLLSACRLFVVVRPLSIVGLCRGFPVQEHPDTNRSGDEASYFDGSQETAHLNRLADPPLWHECQVGERHDDVEEGQCQHQ